MTAAREVPVLAPQAAELLNWWPAEELDWEVDPEPKRRQSREWAQTFQGEREPVGAVEEVVAGGVPSRLYLSEREPSTALVWLHGGGWLMNDPDCYDALARGLVNRAGCAVLSVDYRLIPEHPYPAAIDDAWAATHWAAERFEQVAVGGDSAGGNLAAAVALRARDAGLRLALQLLVYPMLDPALDSPFVEWFAAHYTQLGDRRRFGADSREGMLRLWEAYAPDPADRQRSDVAPARAVSLAGLPPARMVLAEHDLLRGEGEDYARRLREAGVAVEIELYEQQVHGFYAMLSVDDARTELERSADALRRAFAAADRAEADESAMRHATLKDVAKLAGVSTSTVSRVLNDHGYVSAAARERVAAALGESGYRLNTVARELRRRRTIALGLIMHGLGNPVIAEIVAGAQHAAAEQDFDVLLYDARAERERERRIVEALLRRRVDGIVFAGLLDPANLRLAIDARVSVVELARRMSDESPAVVVDNYAGARTAVEHLLALGHREIGYVGQPYDPDGEPFAGMVEGDVFPQRFLAYRDTLAAAGLPLDPSHVVTEQFDVEPAGWGSVESGARYMERLLEQAPALTAVFAASDILAAGVLQTLRRRGVPVPREMSVVAIDDTYARYLAPPLTSVCQHPFEQGFQAATIAIDLLADRTAVRTMTLDSQLVVRESTAPPRRDGRPFAGSTSLRLRPTSPSPRNP